MCFSVTAVVNERMSGVKRDEVRLGYVNPGREKIMTWARFLKADLTGCQPAPSEDIDLGQLFEKISHISHNEEPAPWERSAIGWVLMHRSRNANPCHRKAGHQGKILAKIPHILRKMEPAP